MRSGKKRGLRRTGGKVKSRYKATEKLTKSQLRAALQGGRIPIERLFRTQNKKQKTVLIRFKIQISRISKKSPNNQLSACLLKPPFLGILTKPKHFHTEAEFG
jgi:hypothetical protein